MRSLRINDSGALEEPGKGWSKSSRVAKGVAIAAVASVLLALGLVLLHFTGLGHKIVAIGKHSVTPHKHVRLLGTCEKALPYIAGAGAVGGIGILAATKGRPTLEWLELCRPADRPPLEGGDDDIYSMENFG